MEYAYKKTGFMGKITYEPSSSDSGSHVVLSKDEYVQLKHNHDAYKYQLESEKKAHMKDVAKAKQEVEEYKRKIDAAVIEKINSVKQNTRKELESTEEALDRQIGLNDNLLRIMKERANSKRGMQPKKQRSGYRFVGRIMQTKTISGHAKGTGAIYTDVWTATLETPYDAAISIYDIEDRIQYDLFGVYGKDNGGLLKKMEIKNIWCEDGTAWRGTYAELVKWKKQYNHIGNYLFDFKYMINPKTRLWEVQITTTDPISVIPDLM